MKSFIVIILIVLVIIPAFCEGNVIKDEEIQDLKNQIEALNDDIRMKDWSILVLKDIIEEEKERNKMEQWNYVIFGFTGLIVGGLVTYTIFTWNIVEPPPNY